MYTGNSYSGVPVTNSRQLNNPLPDDHPVMKSITPMTALQMETRSEHNDKLTKERAG